MSSFASVSRAAPFLSSDSSPSLSHSDHSDEEFDLLESSISNEGASILAIQERISKINQKLPLGEVLLTTFPFINAEGKFQGPEADFVLETGLLCLNGSLEGCIERVCNSEHRLIMIPLVLTTKDLGKETQKGMFEHWQNHIVGIVVDREHRRIEYYDSQGKTLNEESRRMFLSKEAYPKPFVEQLLQALAEKTAPELDLESDDFVMVSDWEIISNSERHQGYFDQKTCDYRVTRFFQERLSRDVSPEVLFSKESPLVGCGYDHRSYILDKYQKEIARLKSV